MELEINGIRYTEIEKQLEAIIAEMLDVMARLCFCSLEAPN